MKRVLLAGLLAAVCLPAVAEAQVAKCRLLIGTIPNPMLSQNGAVEITMAGTDGRCEEIIPTEGGNDHYQMTFVGVDLVPSNGYLDISGNVFRYHYIDGYNGKDSFRLKICGTGRSGTGCSHINFTVVP